MFAPIAEGVVDMKAEYGYDTDPTAGLNVAWTNTLPAPNYWTTVRAFRVAKRTFVVADRRTPLSSRAAGEGSHRMARSRFLACGSE